MVKSAQERVIRTAMTRGGKRKIEVVEFVTDDGKILYDIDEYERSGKNHYYGSGSACNYTREMMEKYFVELIDGYKTIDGINFIVQ